MTHLKIFWPEGSRSPRPLSLSEAFEREILPRRPFWDSKTLAEYFSTLNLWAQITRDPPITEIHEKVIAYFAAELLRRPGRRPGTTLSRNTVRKHLRHLKAILRVLGPKARGGIGLLREIPIIESPRAAQRPVTTFSRDQVRSLLEGAFFFQTPLTHPIASCAWWRALIIVLYNTAWRIGTALSVRWEWVDGDWINVPPEAMKRGDIGRRYYLNSPARRALGTIRQKTGPIFPWAGAVMTLQRWRRRIAERTGLPTSELYGFHCVRRTALSAIAAINPLVARIVAGHAMHDVLADHYISDQVIVDTLERLPQP
jgi:integrase